MDIALPIEQLKNIDVILLTHVHKDHFDPSILDFYGKDVPIVCHHEYEILLTELGFTHVSLLTDYLTIREIRIDLIGAKHGKGVVGKLMGNSYGFLLTSKTNETVYITGDTVWCHCVEETLKEYQPTYVIAFAGSAMVRKQHITLNASEIQRILNTSKDSLVIAVHMEAWNHCQLTRNELKRVVISERLFVPLDGETVSFNQQ